MGRSALLVVAVAAIAGVLAWTLRDDEPDGPALPELRGAPTEDGGEELPTTRGADGDRIAIGDPPALDAGGPATVDPDRARESARLVVVGVPRSRQTDATRFVGARVELSSGSARRPRIARLDADLRAEFERLDPVETFAVVVLPRDGARTLVPDLRLAPGEEREVEVELAVGGTVFGRVLDAAGEPLPTATLMIRADPDDGEPTWRRRAILDEDATFEMRGIRPGVVWAELHAGAVNSAERLGPIEEAQTLGPLVLQLPEGNVLEGVVSWPDGAPAVDARVAANPISFARDEPSGTIYARAGEDGRYRLVALRAGTYEVTATPGETRDDVEDAAGLRAWAEARAPGTLDLTLEPGLTISGTVVDDLGAPVPSFRVSAEMLRDVASGPSWRVSSDTVRPEPGEFVIRGLRPGTWLLTAADRGGVSAVEERVQLAGDEQGVRLVLPRPARITGLVRDASGAGRAGVWVYAVRPPREDDRADPRAPRRARSLTDGSFTIDRVAPGRVLVGTSSDDPRAVVLELGPGETREGVTITLDD